MQVTSSKSVSPNPKKVNVNIRIVHTKLSPINQPGTYEPTDVSSRILSQNKGWSFGSNRRKSASDHDDDKKSTKPPSYFIGRKPTKLSYSESMLKKPEPLPQPECNDQSKNISSEFNTCMGTNSMDNVTEDFQKIVNDLEANSQSQSVATPANIIPIQVKIKPKKLCSQSTPLLACTEPTENDDEKSQWTPVKDTIMQFENWLSINKSNKSPFLTSINSPRSPRNIITPKAPSKLVELPISYSAVEQHLATTPIPHCSRSSSSASSRGQTLIKRTICTETILTGVDYDSNRIGDQQNTSEPPSSVSRKSLTSCVTLNLRQTHQRHHHQSFGPIDKPVLSQLDRSESDRFTSKLQQETRHSMCGNELTAVKNNQRGFHPAPSNALCVPTRYDDVLDVVNSHHAKPGRKYVCCKCAVTIPHEQLKTRKSNRIVLFP